MSRGAVEAARAAGVRGWHYRPVPVTDSAVYAEYVAQWRTLAALVAATRRSRFDGSRW